MEKKNIIKRRTSSLQVIYNSSFLIKFYYTLLLRNLYYYIYVFAIIRDNGSR